MSNKISNNKYWNGGLMIDRAGWNSELTATDFPSSLFRKVPPVTFGSPAELLNSPQPLALFSMMPGLSVALSSCVGSLWGLAVPRPALATAGALPVEMLKSIVRRARQMAAASSYPVDGTYRHVA